MQGTTFHRLTREYPPRLRADEVLISAPTIFQNTQSGAAAWLQSLIPLIIGSLSSLVLFVVSRDNPVIIYAMIGVLAISAGLTVAMRFWLQMAVKRLQRTQRNTYLKYLTDEGTKLRLLAETQRQVSRRLYPDTEQLAEIVLRRKYLWERQVNDFDFLDVRVGTGLIPLCRPVRLDISSDPLARSKYDPVLLAEAELLVSTYQFSAINLLLSH